MSHTSSMSDRRMASFRTLSRDHSPISTSRSPLDSWKSYRQQLRAQPSSQHFIRPIDSLKAAPVLYSPSHRSQSPILKMKGEFEGFYQKATGSRPNSPRSFVNNATFEPLILRTKAETKVAAEKAEHRPAILSKLPSTLKLDDISKAISLIQATSSFDCSQLPRQYVYELQRLSDAISQKFSK